MPRKGSKKVTATAPTKSSPSPQQDHGARQKNSEFNSRSKCESKSKKRNGKQVHKRLVIKKESGGNPPKKRKKMKKEPNTERGITKYAGDGNISTTNTLTSSNEQILSPMPSMVDPMTSKSASNIFFIERQQEDSLMMSANSISTLKSGAGVNSKYVPHSQTLENMGSSGYHLLDIIEQHKNDLEESIIAKSVKIPSKRNKKKLKEYSRMPEKVHWDFLLAEMKWMSKDFGNERKIKFKKACECICLFAYLCGVKSKM